MKKILFFILLSFFFVSISQAMETNYLSEEQVLAAQKCATSFINYEAFRKEKMEEGKFSSSYFSLENYGFNYKEKNITITAAVGFQAYSNWGTIVIYPENVNLQKINYDTGDFSDLGDAAKYLATLSFEYVRATEKHVAYFILEHINVDSDLGRKGYAQACVSYFMNEFILKHTEATFVFSDARNDLCKHFFPKYGLQAGKPEAFKNVEFRRSLQVPFYWQRQTEK